MFNTGDGSAPSINCPWAGLGKLHLARKAALAAMQTAAELAAIRQEGASVQQELAGAAVQAEYLAEAAVKTAEKTAEEVAAGFFIKDKLRKQDNLAPLPPKEHRTEFEQFIAERQNHSEA